ncbi:MAG: Bacterial Ig domain [Solirubrobacteraceae bacterium]|nr:Bacterial Ig domain [Solirubrobacteraceae bacterium]
MSRKRRLRLRVKVTNLPGFKSSRRARIERVSFYVDGKLRATDRKAPFAASIDVSKLKTGSHVARVRVVLARTRRVRGRRRVTRTTVILRSRFSVC